MDKGKEEKETDGPIVEPTLSKEDLKQYIKERERRGIVYLSRIPPYMKPQKIRNQLSQFGAIDRVFLEPEDASKQKRRKKSGGNAKKKYTEGWVEYLDKRIAKRVALSLNNTPIGGPKRGYYRDDMWNIKYLPKFKWRHLSEKQSHEKRVKDLKIRSEVSQARKESELYLGRIEQAKVIKRMSEKAAKKEGGDGFEKVYRVFDQNSVQSQEKRQMEKTDDAIPDHVLSRILGGKRRRERSGEGEEGVKRKKESE